MKFSRPFAVKAIKRRELPSHERAGCLAQEMAGSDLLFVTFHTSRTDVQLISGLPAPGASQELFECQAGLGDTVALGSLQEPERVILLDVLMIEKKSQRKLGWMARMEALAQLWERLSVQARERYPLARRWTRALLRAFDEVQDQGGAGLLLRQSGKPGAIQCTER